MQKLILTLLLLSSFAFAANITSSTINNFPNNMAAGSAYTANYKFLSNLEGAYYMYVDTSLNSSEINLSLDSSSCNQFNSTTWNCTGTMYIGKNYPNLTLEISKYFIGDITLTPWISLEQYNDSNPTIGANSTNYSISINGSSDLNQSFNDSQLVVVNATGGVFEVTLKITHNFTNGMLNLENLSIQTGTTSSRTFVIVNGIDGINKTVVMPRGINSNYICVIDRVIQSISEVSSDCNGINETKIECNNLNNNGFFCYVSGNSYYVSGMTHSSILEMNAPSVSSSPQPSHSSSGGGSFAPRAYYRPVPLTINTTDSLEPTNPPNISSPNVSIHNFTVNLTLNNSEKWPIYKANSSIPLEPWFINTTNQTEIVAQPEDYTWVVLVAAGGLIFIGLLGVFIMAIKTKKKPEDGMDG